MRLLTDVTLLIRLITKNHVGVVKLVVVTNPSPDKSPGRFDCWISTESSHFLRLSSYIVGVNILVGLMWYLE